MDIQTHYVGHGSDFDIEMSLYENIVNFHIRGNQLDIDVLYHYYLGSLTSYWNKVTEIYDLNTEQDVRKYMNIPDETIGYGDKFESNKRDFNRFKYIFNKDLSLIKSIYARENTLDVDTFLGLFIYVAKLACFHLPDKELPNADMVLNFDEKIKSRMYPLVNDTGVFSLNGYMYSWVNGVILIGIPSSFSSFDGSHGCPAYFLEHDLKHLADQIKTPFSTKPLELDLTNIKIINENIRPLYFHILNSGLDQDHKEYLIFALWTSIHEITRLNPLRGLDDVYDEHFDDYLVQLDFFNPKDKDIQELLNYIKNIDIFGDNNPDIGRISIIYYFYAYVRKNFPNMYKDLNIDYYQHPYLDRRVYTDEYLFNDISRKSPIKSSSPILAPSLLMDTRFGSRDIPEDTIFD